MIQTKFEYRDNLVLKEIVLNKLNLSKFKLGGVWTINLSIYNNHLVLS